ncbi:protein tyrosine serine phosphatase [Novosphingobium sp. Rr 2-17]|uniref:tyrosine-protein phosphatase n=1 Tax=Novosphingobium sp. Rr 2-17 TaxID=555793 RepID=UPI0002698909|nr:tyrosine-protein phosphatase [Novosphingobium sp. Rr 2-17]EIZ77589.1 protein tyrosine serine phosphatase [Novosphingobium sp. Rr 2-17]
MRQMMMRKATLLLLPLLAVSGSPSVAHAQVPVAALQAHQRLLPLQGGRNFRDLGGYRSADGRTVKWGLLFRSGSMHGLTEADYRYLQGRGIVVVCDLRDRRERASEPVSWPTEHAPRVLSDDYDLDMNYMPKGNPKGWTEAGARAAMASSYPHMLTQFNGQYRRMFGELLAGHAPLAFNCSAGKDRTGIAAALLLTALGVPRATVVQDYLLTNQYLDAKSLVSNPATQSALAGIPPQAVKAMIAADPSYIEAALDVVYNHKGGAEGYIRDVLGLSHADLIKLRDLYLERGRL